MTNFRDDCSEQLFTDLTPEEAAVLEGGFKMRLHNLYAGSITYDDRRGRSGADEPAFYVNGRKKWAGKGLRRGKAIKVGKTISTDSLYNLKFLERDPGKDDPVRFERLVLGRGGKYWTAVFRGSGASYGLNFSFAGV